MLRLELPDHLASLVAKMTPEQRAELARGMTAALAELLPLVSRAATQAETLAATADGR